MELPSRELSVLAGQGSQGADWYELSEAISRAVASVVAHDALRLVGSHPAAVFGPAGSFGFWHGFEPDLGLELVLNAYAGDDPCSPEELDRRPVPVGVVGPGSDGRRDLATRRLLEAHGAGSELRLQLRDARGSWGTLELLREQGAMPFGQEDARRAARLAPALIAVLRGYVTAGPLAPAVPKLPTGVLIVGPDHVVRAVTPEAHRWRAQLQGRQHAPDFTGASFCAGLSLQARRHRRDPRAFPPLVCGPPASYGRWVTCQAQVLESNTEADTESDTDGDVAIVVQAASGEQLLPAFCDWYGITARERQIIAHLCDGAAPKQIARRRDLSVHTVNDHLKAVFRKTGASGRDELIAAITG